jgi:Na+-driven multidrug efflux pump
VVIMLVALGLPLMIGTSILLGKSIGAADYGSAQRIFAFATTLALLLGGTVALISPWLVKPLTVFLVGTGDAPLAGSLAAYCAGNWWGLPAFFLNMFWGSLLRSDGDPEVSRNASLVAVGLNLALDLLLVVVLGWGVAGASLATVLGSTAATVYLAFHLQKGKNHFGFRGSGSRSGWPSGGSCCAWGCTCLLQNISFDRPVAHRPRRGAVRAGGRWRHTGWSTS